MKDRYIYSYIKHIYIHRYHTWVHRYIIIKLLKVKDKKGSLKQSPKMVYYLPMSNNDTETNFSTAMI